MKDKLIGIFLIFVIGWMVGHLHHYHSTRATADELRKHVADLQKELKELQAAIPEAKKVTVKVTAYSNDPWSINVERWRDGKTATNKTARRGYAAADWRVFPPGTRLYVPGYGEVVVEDRGGAVTGNHVDLFVDSRNEALKWGKKNMEIYVLEKGHQPEANL